LRSNLSKMFWPGYRKLITLVCLTAFIFVAFAHAAQHSVKVDSPTSVISTSFLAAADADDIDTSSSDTVCAFCALALAELPAAATIIGFVAWERVETRHRALASSLPPSEFPPPIS